MSDYGPIPVSRLAGETHNIFGALRGGRRVLISRYGHVRAEIEPFTQIRQALLAAYATPGVRLLDELTASKLSGGNPSAHVERAAELAIPAYVTKGHCVFGVLLAADTDRDQLTRDDAQQLDAMIATYLATHPAADAAELADYTAHAQQQLHAQNTVREAAAPSLFRRLDESWGTAGVSTSVPRVLLAGFAASGAGMYSVANRLIRYSVLEPPAIVLKDEDIQFVKDQTVSLGDQPMPSRVGSEMKSTDFMSTR